MALDQSIPGERKLAFAVTLARPQLVTLVVDALACDHGGIAFEHLGVLVAFVVATVLTTKCRALRVCDQLRQLVGAVVEYFEVIRTLARQPVAGAEHPRGRELTADRA